MTRLSLSLAALALAASLGAASATTYDFSYTLGSGSVLSGSIDGALQSDNDTVLVSSINEVSLDGTSVSWPLFAHDPFVPARGEPSVSFSGAGLNLCASVNSVACADDGFAFGDLGAGLAFTSGPLFGASLSELFIDTSWSLSPAAALSGGTTPAAVPVPGAFGLLLAALAGLGFARRRCA